MRVACLTMGRDEDLFLRLWFRHYSGAFGAENCYVLDHASERRAALDEVAGAGAQVLRIPFQYPANAKDGTRDGEAINFDSYRFRLVNNMKNMLLQFYDVVIFNDADEILVPDPAVSAGLEEHFRRRLPAYRKTGVAAGFCMELFHDVDSDPPFRLDLPLFRQRANFCYSLHYSKPAIVTAPKKISSHSAEVPFAIDPDLYLLHLKRLDLDEMQSRMAPRLETFARGQVGETWGHKPDEARSMLGIYMRRQISAKTGAHRAFLKAHFKKRPDGLFLVDSPHPNGRMYLARSAVTPEQIHGLQSKRHRLPPAFADLAV